LTAELVQKFTPFIESLTLLPSSGGRFEVTAGDRLIFSKKAAGRHAQPGEIAQLLHEQAGFREMPLD
jgi:selenoprotein W-related protein